MTLTKKFSAIAAVLAIGVLSIYATTANFLTMNRTADAVNVTLQLSNGAEMPFVVAPNSSLPFEIGNETVKGITIYGAYDPAGVNAIVAKPTGGTVIVRWQGTNAAEVDPSEIS
jgi:hypothetical protein